MAVTFRDEAIVLKTHKLAEADKIIVLVSRANGKISAVAKGVRRTKSKHGAVLSPFMRVDAQFSLGRNLDIVQEATIIDGFATDLVGDYDKYLAAAQMADVLDKLLPEPHQAVEQQYLLLVRALKMLVSDLPAGISPNLVAVSYTLRALSIAGWEIDPYNLGNAGLTLPKQLPMEVFEMSIDALLQGDWQGCLTVIAEHPPLESELTRLVASFAVQHLERRLRSFTI